MRTSIVIAATLLVGASATGVGALTLTIPGSWYGSDTLQFVTTDTITDDPDLSTQATTQYKAGGSGAGQGAMVNATGPAGASQSTAPMSKMLTNGSSLCTAYGGTKGSAANNASGVSIGMDAVDVYSSLAAGGQAICNGTADATGFGLAYSGVPTGVFANGNAGQNWKWALALLYGGLDLSAANGGTNDNPDCNSAARKALVANWSNLFQKGASCTNSDASICNAASPTGFGGALGHAFRRDDASGTSDVFSSLIGLQINMPSPSASSNDGFGASPYCNALNWDTNTPSNNGGGFCALGPHDQFVGPGGVIDPASSCVFTDFKSADLAIAETCGAAGTGNHRMPPQGAWGSAPYTTSSSIASAWDVLPTGFQDNDPIRRSCLGNSTGNAFKSGEEVCNVDGQLGVVLAIPSSDFIVTSLSLVQYPANKCTGSFFGAKPPQIHNCAPFATGKHNGECPNGDSAFANSCFSPVDTGNNTSQCLNNKTQFAIIQNRNLGSYDGRRHNLAMMDGDMNNGTMKYIADTIQNGSSSPPIDDFFGGMGRIHTVQTVFDVNVNGGNPTNVACQMLDATDQVACLAQADPCSFGYAGDGGKTWNERANGTVCATLVAGALCTGSGTGGTSAPYSGASCPTACTTQGGSTTSPTLVSDSVRIDQVYPTSTTVLALGSQTTTEYQVGRKLYFNSLVGFPSLVSPTTGWADQHVQGELSFGEYESNTANMTTILPTVGYFPYSSSAQAAPYNAPFCEDFNEALVCAATESAGTWTNNNACTANGSLPVPTTPGLVQIPSTGSICGNGIVEAYEECDNGTPGVTSGPGTAVNGGNGASGNNCSTICRCSGTTSYEPTNPSGFKCQ
jgi:hypothetical protein